MTLDVKNLSVSYGGKPILSGVEFTLSAGQWLMVVGPNGAGKSTLINAISQGAPYAGAVLLDGKDVSRMKPRERAKRIGALAQHHSVGYGFTAEEVVRMGRYAYSGGWPRSSHAEDAEKTLAALDQAGLMELRGQSALTLSGGELQRVFLAQIWAQDPSILLLDEPSNHLDLSHQRQTFDRIQSWLAQPDRAVLSVVHDLSLALAYGTDALLLRNGETIASGAARSVLSQETLRRAYDIDVHDWMRRMLRQWQE
ncbi:MAG: ABC transporter ATP-binding protein [Oscillospiraceae bacterium]|jgi:iron complex transport system ATP-binding protein|nr:ABC transporter ATP-binding protein [Oscillospiraceae bacterium]